MSSLYEKMVRWRGEREEEGMVYDRFLVRVSGVKGGKLENKW